MIELHHLDQSRSIRVLWLLEELGVPFTLIPYQRDENHRAPPALKAVHLLGKSPVIVDGSLVLAESSAILRYLEARYGNGRFTPPAGSDAAAVHDGWVDYVEGSAAFPIMLKVIGDMTGGLPEALSGFVLPQLDATFGYIGERVGAGPFLMGDRLMLADMQMLYLLQVAERFGLLGDHPKVAAYLALLIQQPGLKKAIERGGSL
ncbi:glutathione S-transferase [Lichenihabitans sp. Uapishka_5]|uniref:glutathione S-transferase family protein n=1 Tax=Lichenihabitans sp. Uapishka_5 TaxID=3037302 RepID=UPI0029E81D6B|nr:glutathione S-transferase [Lichenihabitans sp. Uapishka_5]MDX7952356.1 glutathione S-transferase [Lichenihabitans sp. Uapishka_5]